jgi:hypothetical protein
MRPSPLLVDTRLGPLAFGDGTGETGTMLGFFRAPGACFRYLAVLGDGLLAALIQLAFAAPLRGDPAASGEGKQQAPDDD